MNLSELRKLAEEATPGPWEAQSPTGGRRLDWYIDTHYNQDGPEPVWADDYPVSEDDARFIAALDPQTVLRLLDVAEAAAQVANFDSFFDDGSPRHPTLAAALKAGGAMTDLDAALAASPPEPEAEEWRPTNLGTFMIRKGVIGPPKERTDPLPKTGNDPTVLRRIRTHAMPIMLLGALSAQVLDAWSFRDMVAAYGMAAEGNPFTASLGVLPALLLKVALCLALVLFTSHYYRAFPNGVSWLLGVVFAAGLIGFAANIGVL